jgi:Tfp pilus assembly protein PilF
MRKIFRPTILLLSTAIACGLIAVGCAMLQDSPETVEHEMSALEPGRKPIVLVSPIDTLVTEEDIAHLSKAIAPLIRRDLFCVQDISVVPTADTSASMKTYFLKKTGLRKQALSHGADIITVGILKENESESTITIEFTVYDVLNDKTILRTKVEDRMSRAFRLEKEIINQFIEALGMTLSEEERERIASNAPSEVDAAIAYGRGLKELQRDKYADALIALEEAGDFDGSLAIVDMARAKVFEKFNAPAKATQTLEQAVAVDKYYAEAWYLLNIHMVTYQKNNDLAMDYCYQALEVAPRFGKAHLSLGARLYSIGDLKGAIEETKTAAELLPVDAMPRYSLGIFYRDLGDPVEAEKWFKEALRRNPGFERARIEIRNLPKK